MAPPGEPSRLPPQVSRFCRSTRWTGQEHRGVPSPLATQMCEQPPLSRAHGWATAATQRGLGSGRWPRRWGRQARLQARPRGRASLITQCGLHSQQPQRTQAHTHSPHPGAEVPLTPGGVGPGRGQGTLAQVPGMLQLLGQKQADNGRPPRPHPAQGLSRVVGFVSYQQRWAGLGPCQL